MILDFGSLTRRGLLADLEHPVEIWWGHIADRAEGWEQTGEETVEDRKTTDLPAVREQEAQRLGFMLWEPRRF